MKLKLLTSAIALALAAGVGPVFANDGGSGGGNSDGGGRQGIGASGTGDDLLLDNVVHYGRAHQNVVRAYERMQPTPKFNSGMNFSLDWIAKHEANETGIVYHPDYSSAYNR